jgi:HK97 family phage major capsid protein
MGSPIVKIPARTDKNHTTSVAGGLTVTRRPETVAGTASQVQLEQVTMEAHSLFGLSYATEELLRDSPISYAALLSAGFSDQFVYHLIKERLYGTGIGEFLGVLNSPCLVSVAKETGQAADTILYENILKMRSRCWGYSKAAWLANHDTMPQLMLLNQAVGTGGMPVWQPSAREDHPDMLLGRPLYFSEYAKTVGDQGDIILGNWGEYLEGTYQPMATEESIHVRFVNHERTFKFFMRNAGQPWWRTPLTPAYSSQTLSPFVVLDAR